MRIVKSKGRGYSIASILAQLWSECNKMWLFLYFSACYTYSVSQATMNWQSAKSFCEGNSAQLAIHGLEDVTTKVSYDGDTNLWIGFSDIETEGTWVAVDGSDVTISNWQTGQPNNNNAGEDCAMLKKSWGWNAGDSPCSQSFIALCEVNTCD